MVIGKFPSLYAVTVAAAVPPFPRRVWSNFIKQIHPMCNRPSIHLQLSIALPPAGLHVEFHPRSDWQADWLTLGYVHTSPEHRVAVICGSPPPVRGDFMSDKTLKSNRNRCSLPLLRVIQPLQPIFLKLPYGQHSIHWIWLRHYEFVKYSLSGQSERQPWNALLKLTSSKALLVPEGSEGTLSHQPVSY